MNSIKNSSDIRTNNLRRIIRILHGSGPLTKSYLSEQLGLSFPTILNLLNILQQSGIIEEVGYAGSSGGRKPMCFQFNNNAKFSIGIDVNTHYLFLSCTNLGGEVLCTERCQYSFTGKADYWKYVSSLIDQILEKLQLDKADSLGICISMPTLMFSYEGDEDYVPTGNIHQYFNDKVTVVSAAEVAGLSYLWHSDIKKSAFVILLDRYIEAATIEYDDDTGHFVSRPNALAHATIRKDGKRCVCGKRGCLQTLCSASTIVDTIAKVDTSFDFIAFKTVPPHEIIDYQQFFNEIDAGNKDYAALWREYMEVLANMVINLHIIHETDIILGGEMYQHVKNDFDAFCDIVRELSCSDDVSYIHLGFFGMFDKAMSAALSLCDNYLAELPT